MAAKIEIPIETKDEIIKNFENDILWHNRQIEKLSYLLALIDNDL